MRRPSDSLQANLCQAQQRDLKTIAPLSHRPIVLTDTIDYRTIGFLHYRPNPNEEITSLSDCHRMYVPPFTCYNFDTHNPITIIFGRSVAEKVRNQTMVCFPTSPFSSFCITLRNRKPRKQRTGALCMQHSPTPAAYRLHFS